MHLLLIVFGIFLCGLCETSNFNQDYPNISVCVISEYQSAFRDSSYSYKNLKRMLESDKPCTHVYGNLVIRGLDRLADGSDPDLRFLESIEEISGNLLINDNTISRIPLVNLKVIRGLSMVDKQFALEIYHNWRKGKPDLLAVDLRSLRVVMNKDVLLSHNPGLQYLHHRVDWTQLIEDPSKQKIHFAEFPISSNRTYECHSQCDSWESSSNVMKKFCFGPTESECQKRTKCVLNQGSKWCNFTKLGEIPCNKNCAGGCHGQTSGNCAVCSKYFKRSNCTDTCAMNHDPVYGRDFSKGSQDNLIYTVGGLCTRECPASLLDQNKICIFQCNFDQFYRLGNRCMECPKNCKEQFENTYICNLTKVNPTYIGNGRTNKLNIQTLKNLTMCTTIIGQLYIDDDSFRKYGVTIPLLHKHLGRVREISGDLTINLQMTSIHNLTFLSNLEEIRHSVTPQSVGSALSIYAPSLKFLGLKKLLKIYGMVTISATNETCYVKSIPWREISSVFNIASRCNKTCDPICTNGCWGPGKDFCYKCQFHQAGSNCVKNCTDSPGFFSQSTNNTVECQKCHPLCKKGCSGPSPKECNQKCKYYMENETCVKTCSLGLYPFNRNGSANATCNRCHDSCHLQKDSTSDSFACSGPSNILGQGGCAMCEKIIRTGNNESRCHKGPCPAHYIQVVIPESTSPDQRIVQQSSCEPCHPLCSNCIGLGSSMKDCNHCKGYIYDDKCVAICPNEVKNYSKRIALGGNCPRCHGQCKNGCSMENDNTKCHQCVNKKLVHNGHENNFSCVTNCPPGRNYTEYRNGEIVCLSLAETSQIRQRKIIILIVIGCVVCLAIGTIFSVVCCRWKSNQAKTKAEIKARYSNYKEPNMKNMKEDHMTRPPNMKRLQMIPLSDLIFDMTSKPLGSGAFGKVFRGCWKVPRHDNKIYNLDVVIKIIHNSSKTSTDEFLEEAKIMASVSHRYCLPLIGVCLTLDKPCLVSTYAEYGSLDKYLHQHGRKISSYSMLIWAEQIADGMAYLNLRNIIHRDLAARNILVNSKNIIQITDFGLARFVDESEDSIVVKSGRVPIRWLALETLLHATYSSATDVWAYGVTLWEIFTYGKRPYENLETNEIKTYLQQGNRLCQPEISTLDVYMVMIKCWLDDPLMRPTFAELITIFEQFALTPKRFLYLQQEHVNNRMSKANDNRGMIGMHQISMDSEFRQTAIVNNKSDEMSWGTALHNDSAYPLISNNYIRDQKEDQSFLPSRKKTRRNISMDKIRSFSKFDLSKLLSSKLQRDPKAYGYQPTSNYEGAKTTCTSFDSILPLMTQRSLDYEVLPMNHQMYKLKKETLPNSPHSSDGSSKSENPLKCPERVFIDKDVATESASVLTTSAAAKSEKEMMKPPNLPPLDIPKLLPSTEETVESKNENLNHNSPDSGNSHNFDIDDYLVPSHISSAGYYNLTPSPESNPKPPPNLCNSPLLMNNADYVDDGYLEPVKINR